MAGVVQATLADKEIERLVVWYGALVIVAGENTPEDDALADKIQGWRNDCKCKTNPKDAKNTPYATVG